MKTRSLLGILGPLVIAVACSQSDAGITTNVKAKLVADDLVKARQISVDTKDHVVTLTGAVQSSEEKSQALQIARNTKGVSNVVDSLTIEGGAEQGAAPTTGTEPSPMTGNEPSSTAEPPAVPKSGKYGDVPVNPTDMGTGNARPMSAMATDSDITAKVKAALIGERGLNGQQISVDTKNGVVTLSGTVATSADKAKAEGIAGNVANVTRVEDKLTVRAKTQ